MTRSLWLGIRVFLGSCVASASASLLFASGVERMWEPLVGVPFCLIGGWFITPVVPQEPSHDNVVLSALAGLYFLWVMPLVVLSILQPETRSPAFTDFPLIVKVMFYAFSTGMWGLLLGLFCLSARMEGWKPDFSRA